MTNELYHHGRLGQHWGERNGPPYPLSKGVVSTVYTKKRKKDSKLSKEDKKAKKSELDNMSNEELQGKINRLNNEQKIKELLAPKKVSEENNFLRSSVGIAKTIKEKVKDDKSISEEFKKGLNLGIEGAENLKKVDEAARKITNKKRQAESDLALNESLKHLTDKEVSDLYQRINLEKQYADISNKHDNVSYKATKEWIDIVGGLTTVALAGTKLYKSIEASDNKLYDSVRNQNKKKG